MVVRFPKKTDQNTNLMIRPLKLTTKAIAVLICIVAAVGTLGAQNFTPTAGNTDTLYIPSSGYATFSDPGGPGGTSIGAGCPGQTYTTAANDYPNCSCTTTTLICPDTPGVPVTLDFTEFTVFAYFDYVVVYDGPDRTAPILYDNGSVGSPQYNDECTGPQVVTSSHPGGCLLVDFYATGGSNEAGFVAGMSIPLPDDASIASLTPPSSTTPTLQNIDVTVKNNGINPLDSVMIEWMLSGVPQTPYNYTGPTLGPGATSASINLGSFTPAGGETIKVWTSMPNGNNDSNNTNDTLSRSYCLGLAGNYTINSGAATAGTNFASFADAVSALACGVAGPVVFDVVPGSGPYTEQPVIPEINGTSSTNTVTFNGHGEILQFASTSSAKFALELDGADWVTIDSLNIIAQSTTYGTGILLTNGADNNTIKHCVIDNSGITSTSSANSCGITMNNSVTSAISNGAFGNNNLIDSNRVMGGYYGITLYGVLSGGSDNNVVSNNIVEDFYYYGISAEEVNNLLVSGNDISRPRRASFSIGRAIDIDGVDGYTVVKNSIHSNASGNTASTSSFYCIYLDGADGTSGQPNLVANNLIYDINSNGDVYGVYNYGSDYVNAYHNTLVFDNTSATTTSSYETYAFEISSTYTATDFRVVNNIVYSTRGGVGELYGIYIGSSGSIPTLVSDHNDFYIAGAGGMNYYGYLTGVGNLGTLADWQTASGQDLNSFDLDPLFANPSSFDFQPQRSTLNNSGINVGVTEDFYGTTRGSSPDPGAIEFSGPPNDAGISAILNPQAITTATTQNFDVEIHNYGTNPLDSVTVGWAINGTVQGTMVYTTSIAPFSSSSSITLGTVTPTAGDTYEAWTIMPNGVADMFSPNDTNTVSVCIGMSGNYTIDANNPTAGTNFASFGDAIAAMSGCGIVGPVVFDVVPGSGPYVEQPLLPEISGASSTNTISFIGHGDTLMFASPSGAKYAFALDGADWVILDSLRIQAMSATYGTGILLINGADNNIVRNCIIDNSGITSTTSTNSAGITMNNSFTSTTTNGACGSNNLIDNNFIMGGYNGITLYGYLAGGSDNNVISNNTIQDYYSYGISIEEVTGVTVSGNDISRPTRSSISTSYTIDIDGVVGATIEKNRIHNNSGGNPGSTSTFYGIYLYGADATGAQPNMVINNLIYDINSSGSLYGIYCYSSDHNYIAHNTISFSDQNTSTSSLARGFYQYLTADSVAFLNNIVNITRSGTGTNYGSYYSSSSSVVLGAGNAYNIKGSGTNHIGYWSSTSYDTIANWQTANPPFLGTGSISARPRFLDEAGGDLTPAAPALDNIDNNVGVTEDFFGNPRLAVVDPGAIEFTPPPDDAGVTEFISPFAPVSPGTYPVTVVFGNFGALTLTDVDVYVNITDGVIDTTLGPLNYVGNLPSTGRDTVTLGNFNFDFANSGYTLTGYTSLPNGSIDANFANDTTILDICMALPAGNYTIDSSIATGSGNFQSFDDAIAALQCGVTGDVTFTVAPNTYNGPITLGPIPGTGPGAQVVFDGQNADSVLITHDGSIRYATILLEGSDWVTFTNFSIEATGLHGFGIQMNTQANHNTVSNCTITTSSSSSSVSGGIIGSSSLTSNTGNGENASYLTVRDNTFVNGQYGVRVDGDAGLLSFGVIIEGNTFTNQEDNAIYFDDTDSLIVKDNNVSTSFDNYSNGIYLFDANGYFEVTGNTVNVPYYAIYLNDANTNGGAATSKVINNMTQSSGNYGLYLNYVRNTVVYHNTTMGAPAYRMYNGDSMDIRNNIFVGINDYAYEDPTLNLNLVVDYNIYYSTDPVNLGLLGSATYSSLAAAQAAFPPFNIHSLEGMPTFVGPDDLHRVGLFGNDNGDNTVGVTTDIDGDTRPMAPSSTVDIGADEYEPFANDVSVIDILGPELDGCGDSLAVVTVVIHNGGTATQSNVPVTVDFAGTLNTSISNTLPGPLASDQNDTLVVGMVSTYDGAVGTITAYTTLAGEQFTKDDTITVNVEIDSIPDAPVIAATTACTGETQQLYVQSSTFRDVEWYDAIGGNLVGRGDTFNTPPLTNTTSYYAKGINGASVRVGRTAPSSTAAFISNALGWGLRFQVHTQSVIDSITVYPTGTGDITIIIYDVNENVYGMTRPIPVSGSGQLSDPVQLYLGFNLPPGVYYMGMNYTGITDLIRSSGGNTYPYTEPTGSVEILNGTLTNFSSSTYSYYWFYDWVIGKFGCESPYTTATANVSKPVSDAGADATICLNDTATLTAGNGVAWNWSTGDTTQSIDLSPASTSNYSLTITDQYGCTGTADQATVNVNALPNANAGVDDTICEGSSTTLTASGGTSYLWSNSATTASTSVTVSTETTYMVTVTDANNCSATDDVTIGTYTLPSGNAPADADICAGNPITLTATGGASYRWSTGATHPSITVGPTSTTTYSVTTTDVNGCVGTDDVTVTVNALPTLTITAPAAACIFDIPFLLTATPAGGTFSGPGVNTATDSFRPGDVGLGTYTIRYSFEDGNGCVNTATKDIVVDSTSCFTGTTDITFADDISVYPNPFTNDVIIDIDAVRSGPVTITMVNLLGQQVYSAEMDAVVGSNTHVIKTETDLAQGFYIVQVRSGDESFETKLLKAK